LANGTFKSTRTNTFFPCKSTFDARPSTFNFSQQIAEAWNDARCSRNEDCNAVRVFVEEVNNADDDVAVVDNDATTGGRRNAAAALAARRLITRVDREVKIMV
jgi:hypothetical protein